MASFARSALPQREWTVEECALFAARKEYELLKLLSTDRKAFATARRLGFMRSAGHPHSRNRKLQLMPTLELLGWHRSRPIRRIRVATRGSGAVLSAALSDMQPGGR